MERHSHKTIYKLRGSPAWKHTITQDIQAPWESSMETYIHSRGYTSSVGSSINTIGYTSSVGVQHGNTQSHVIYKRPWESSMETHIHTRGYIQALWEIIYT